MPLLFLTPFALPHLGLGLVMAAFAVFLALRRTKGPATWWLLASTAGWVIAEAGWVIPVTSLSGWGLLPLSLTWIGPMVANWCALGFAYSFLGRPYPREAAAVLGVALLGMGAGSVAMLAFFVGGVRPPWVIPAVSLLQFGLVIGVVGVAFRRATSAPSRGRWSQLRATATEETRAFRALLVVYGLLIFQGIIVTLRGMGVVDGSVVAVSAVLTNVFLTLGLLVVYVNFVPEPTSFRVKVTGYALAAIAAVLSLAALVVFPAEVVFPNRISAYFEVSSDARALYEARADRYGLLMVGSFLAVLATFPLFLRASVTRPLERLLGGVRRIDQGDLAAEVPVRVHDEIGQLTAGFNRMAASLRVHTEDLERLVTERTAALEAAQARLIHAEKMASLGRFTSGVAHEIKNPLNFVTNFAQLNTELADELREVLAEGDPAAAEEILTDLAQNAASIREHGARADAIVAGMMEHVRSGPTEHRTVHLSPLVAEHAELALQSFRTRRPDLDVALSVQTFEAVEVEAAPKEIGRVVVQLVANALDAVADRTATEPGHTPLVTVRTGREDGHAVVAVEDNGTGMDADTLAKAFEPFFTTKPTGQGNTGLGLSLAHDVVEQGHGGRLEVVSRQGHGSTFSLRLPVASAHLGDTDGQASAFESPTKAEEAGL